MRESLIIIIILSIWCAVFGVEPATADTSSASNTMQIDLIKLLEQREKDLQDEYGYRDTDTLKEVAKALNVSDIVKWKQYLNVEPDNPNLDNSSLRKLDITRYRAFLAKQYSDYDFTEISTLTEISAVNSVPIKKLRTLLGLPSLSKSRDGSSLQALGLDIASVDSLIAEFKHDVLPYGLSVTLVGMLVVFIALFITSIIISQLIHLNKKPKTEDKRLVIDSRGKLIVAPDHLSNNLIAAAITALHIYKTSIEERRRLALTFKRTPTNQWRASGVIDMPNRELFRSRR